MYRGFIMYDIIMSLYVYKSSTRYNINEINISMSFVKI